MQITPSSFSGEKDLRAMEALARQFPANNLHVTDLPYRLSSWALDDPGNICLWKDPSGRLLAWAILQIPFGSVDFVCHPETESTLLGEILAWVDARSADSPEIVPLGTPTEDPCWFVNVFSTQKDRIRALESAGYACQADVGEYSWSKVFMQRPVDLTVKQYRLPEGFVIRPLAGEAEVEAYVDLHRATFGTDNMTVGWRMHTLRHPDYVPDLDLVVAAPDGRLVAFCISWLGTVGSEKIGQIEPLGCHADFRRYALGRVVLTEALRRLQTHGATRLVVETDDFRNTAFQLYGSLGFQVIKDVLVYRKDY